MVYPFSAKRVNRGNCMFEVIKKLFAGIFSFFLGLLPGKKESSGYFLELKQDEVSDLKPVSSNNTKEVTAVGKPEPTPNQNPVAAIQKIEVKKTEPAAKSAKSAKSAKPVEVAETTFAPKYVFSAIGSSNGRRYPGPDMNMYLDMARGIKTP